MKERFFPYLGEEGEGFVRWFVNLRWIAFGATCVACAVVWALGLLESSLPYLALLCACVGLSNVAFYLLQGKIKAQHHLFAQIGTDIVLLTLLLYFSGWCENPFSVIYVFHVFITSLIFGKRAFPFALAIWICFLLLTLAQFFNLIPHFPLFGTELVKNPVFISGCVTAFGILIFVSFYFASVLAESLRERMRRERELYLELTRSSRLAVAGEVSAHIAHNISTPLSIILARVSLIEEGTGNFTEHIKVIKEQTQKILENLKSFLGFLKRESESEVFDINRVLLNVIHLVGFLADKKGIKLVTELSKVPAVKGNPGEIEQVFLNIIMNAIDALEHSNEKIIKIKTYKDENFVVCEVSDTGCGIPEEIKGKVFEPFFTTKRRGTGIGLSISKRIVQRHGGKIYFNSKEGEGTTFFICLPYHEEGSCSR